VHAADERGVAQMIVDQALELGTDLIVLSTHGSTGLRDALLGSIAQQVIHEGRVPVLLAHPARVEPSAPTLMVRQILLPLDGEKVHEVAIPAALAMAHAWGATIHLVNVVPTVETLSGQEATPGTVLPNAMRAVLDLSQEGAAEYLERVRQRLDVPSAAKVLRGDPAKSIVAEASSTSADLIVMATHGRMGLGAFWSASVAPKVLRDARLPLLLLRAPSA
jgi:nucleotide-binding universal stress UspA family protein